MKLLLSIVVSLATGWAAAITPGAQTFQYFESSMTVMEAENFTVGSAGGWSPEAWAHSNKTRFASTVANTFLSRRAFLYAAPNATSDAVATATVQIGTAGAHQVLVRYEAAYRFETPFTVTVEQGGKKLVDGVTYGLRATPKVWAFAAGRAHSSLCGPGLQGECRWPYGATENVVWEGTEVVANLKVGPATITLRVDNSTRPGHMASRNVDTVVLTPNATDVALRLGEGALKYEATMLPLDGLLSQAGEVFMKIHNYGPKQLVLRIPYTYSHSPYYSMHLILPSASGKPPNMRVGSGCTFHGGPLCPVINLTAGATSEWTDVGRAMGTFNHGTWNLPHGNYTVTFGVLADTQASKTNPINLGTFDAKEAPDGKTLQVIVDASTRASRRIRPRNADFVELMAALDNQTKSLPKNGKPPTHVPIFCGTFTRNVSGGGGSRAAGYDPAYDAAQKRFETMFSISPTSSSFKKEDCTRPFDCNYIDVRGSIRNLTKLAQMLEQDYVQTGLAAGIHAVSFGDEVALPRGNSADFQAWATANHLSAADVGCPGGWTSCTYSPGLNTSSTNPKLFYHSNKFSHDFGLAAWKKITQTITAKLPNAAVGCNFSPTKYYTDERTGKQEVVGYTGDVAQWLRNFREGGMTLPWSEDWVWQTPVGTQQMVTLALDVFRSGLRTPKTTNPPSTSVPAPPIMMYIMAHFPGNAHTSWQRQFWGDIAHGVKMVNLFQFRTAISGYTCDYVDQDGGSYEAVRSSLNALGTFDDIVAKGVAQAQGAKAALLYSETADIYFDTAATFGAELRAVYIALRHAQIPVDIVTEDDAVAGELTRLGYHTLYVVEPHVSDAAGAAIAKWVNGGGYVFATAGAGLINENNVTNSAMATLLGVTQHAIFEGGGTDPDSIAPPPRAGTVRGVQFIKQDLPFAPKLDTVIGGDEGPTEMGVYGAKSIFELAPAAAKDARVLRRFGSDNSPALITRVVGTGEVTYAGFLPGLAYFKPATPLRPVDRSASNEGFDHFVPSSFLWDAGALIAAPLAGVAGAQPVDVSAQLVESGVITADKIGTAIPLINWSGQDSLKAVNVTLRFTTPFKKATLASGGTVETTVLEGGVFRFTLDLGIGDAIVLRP